MVFIPQRRRLLESDAMKIMKVIIWIVLSGLILTQLLALIEKIGNASAYNLGFVIGKLLLIGVFLIIGKIATRAVNQRFN